MTGVAAPRTDRAESAVQVALMLAVGGVAAAASWAHVVSLAASHGQPGWLAIADAAVIETTALSAGLEVRRRRRSGRAPTFVLVALVVAVVLSLAAQVAEAERSVWGWVLAAVPALGFLVLVKIALGRTPADTDPMCHPLPHVPLPGDASGATGEPREDHAVPAAPVGVVADELELAEPPVAPARLPAAEWEPAGLLSGNGRGPGGNGGKSRDRLCNCPECGGRLVGSSTFYRHRARQNGGSQ